MNIKKTCSNCINGASIAVNSDILCRIKGPVTADYCCSKHKLAPFSKTVKDMDLKCMDCENFLVEISVSEEGSSMGLCQLFSVRPFDGKQKNACSKFSQRSELRVG